VNSFREFLRIVDYQDEDFVIETLLRETNPDDVFWDIGANIGTHACYVGQKASCTIAIEPFPDNADQARTNLHLNNVDAEVRECALGESRGDARLTVPNTDECEAGVGTFSLLEDSVGDEAVNVEVIQGDDLVSEHELPFPDVMKIDVEGGELSVLRGFRRGLDNARTVLVEVHPRHVDLEEVIQLLESEGFAVEILRQRNDETHLLAKSTET
jgi:FkbM family methyltransferase